MDAIIYEILDEPSRNSVVRSASCCGCKTAAGNIRICFDDYPIFLARLARLPGIRLETDEHGAYLVIEDKRLFFKNDYKRACKVLKGLNNDFCEGFFQTPEWVDYMAELNITSRSYQMLVNVRIGKKTRLLDIKTFVRFASEDCKFYIGSITSDEV